MTRSILVTGGAGYIGSHMCALLGAQGYRVVILDNFSNSDPAVVERLARITEAPPDFVQGDVRDAQTLQSLFARHSISAVFHFAGLKAVGESTERPLDYFSHNVTGSLNLVQQMQAAGVKTLVFSSSATVYGEQREVPIPEAARPSPNSPYGRTKLMVEDMLGDLARSDPAWRIACLRCFNPVGAHDSGLLGESPVGVPNNLMPWLVQVAAGERPVLRVFGDDYPTRDGTGVRDYIHVLDLVEGHLAALEHLEKQQSLIAVNLGTGQGVSVLELVRAFEAATDCRIPYEVVARRPGDVAQWYADASLARRLLAWEAKRSLEAMCQSSWGWARNRPGA